MANFRYLFRFPASTSHHYSLRSGCPASSSIRMDQKSVTRRNFHSASCSVDTLSNGSTKLRNGHQLFYHKQLNLSHQSKRCWSDELPKCETEFHLYPKAPPMGFETGNLARFADASAVARIANTSVLVTGVSRKSSKVMDFLPLTVDYRVKAAAEGRIPTNYLRRELGPSEAEILTARMIDRSLRPMFPKDYNYETQVVCNVLAADGCNPADIISINAASLALTLSDIPFNDPVGAVRVGLVDDKVVMNPTRQQLDCSQLNLVLCGVGYDSTTEACPKICMIECGANFVSHETLRKCITEGSKAIGVIIKNINQLKEKHGRPKREYQGLKKDIPENILKKVEEIATKDLYTVFRNPSYDKIQRDRASDEVGENTLNAVKEQLDQEMEEAKNVAALSASTENESPTIEIPEPVDPQMIRSAFDKCRRDVFRNLILDEELRCDGRSLDMHRPVSCEVDLYSPLHGSSIFQRGQTQVLCTVTFDALEAMFSGSKRSGNVKERNFMLHYDFPSYATNEIGMMAMRAGRRELGHGALAERGLVPTIPMDYPFTIRLTAEVLESNGSSSMASICAGTLALMDAGVPIEKPVAGVAMGMVSRSDENGDITDYKILHDLVGIEDYMGDMDFKIGGTEDAFTAIQMDVKITGLPLNILFQTLAESLQANQKFLTIMKDCISEPRNAMKENGPKIDKISIPMEKRAQFIGSGGINIRQLQDKIGVRLNMIEEGVYQIFAPNSEAMDEAQGWIKKELAKPRETDLDFGAIYCGKITEVKSNGVMVQLAPGTMPMLCPLAQLDQRTVAHPSALGLEVGQEFTVKYFGRESDTGRPRISHKVLLKPAVPRVKYMLNEGHRPTRDLDKINPWQNKGQADRLNPPVNSE